MPYRLGILTTHPIQYQVPWFCALANEHSIDLTVFYCMIPDERQQGDGFGINFKWDIPLLDGYKYEVLENVAKQPSVTNFWGCDTPGIKDIVKNRKFDAFIVNGWVVKSCIQLLRACRQYNEFSTKKNGKICRRNFPLCSNRVSFLMKCNICRFEALVIHTVR